MELQDADRRILRELQRDATLSLKELAERVAMSSSTVWRRVQDLESAGVITGKVTLTDPAQLGLTVCMLLSVNIVAQSAETRQEFERFVQNHDRILQCFSMTGAHDYTLIVRTKQVSDYERFLMDELLAHSSVASAQSRLLLRQVKNSTALPV
ncbi:MAG: Lrp/AsnC family transcriptional regulator [Pseudomonadota bacterium]